MGDSPLRIDEILLKKGWVTAEQLQSAREKLAEEEKNGRKIRIGEFLVELKLLTADRLREALATQDKVPMRCPACKKTYNVRGFKPGTRALCKACGKALVPPATSTDLHVDDTTENLQHVPVGEAVDAALADSIPGYKIE